MDLQELEGRMIKSIDVFSQNLSEVRAGRANPAILNKISVEYYGVPTPINQVAGISVPEARTIVIQPWDASVLKAIEKAILASDIGLNPNNDGKVIRLNFPELTADRRKELAKDIRKMAEDAKVSIRSIRRDGMDIVKEEQPRYLQRRHDAKYPAHVLRGAPYSGDYLIHEVIGNGVLEEQYHDEYVENYEEFIPFHEHGHAYLFIFLGLHGLS